MTDTRNADLLFASNDFLVHVAALGTALPTDFTDLPSPWQCPGWMAQDGPTLKTDRQTKDVFAAGSLAPIRTLTTQQTRTVQAVCEEALNPVARALYDDVDISDLNPTSGIVAYDLSDIDPDHRYAAVFDSWDGDKRVRYCAPNVKVTSRADEKRIQSDIDQLDMTFTCYKGTSGEPSASQIINFGGVDVSGFFS
jgi:hypothetical protein